MKRYIIGLITLLMILFIYLSLTNTQPSYYLSLIDRGGVKYQQDSQKPYSGKVFRLHKNGQKQYEETYKDGKLDGLTTVWHENGQKSSKLTYKDGKKDGLSTYWHENGQKWYEDNYKDGKLDGLRTEWYGNGQKYKEGTFKDGKYFLSNSWNKNGDILIKNGNGLITRWYDNGKKEEEGTYKDGERDGLWTEWYGDGQKSLETTFKNGKLDGLYTQWYENGQKKEEGTYKDGKTDGLTTYPDKTTTKTEPIQSNCDRRAVREFATETSLLGGGNSEIMSLQSLGNDIWIVGGVNQQNSPVGGLISMAWTYRIKCNGNKLEVVAVATEILH